MNLHGLAAGKADGEALDQLAPIAQGLGGIDNALGLALHGGDKALLRGDIGVEEDAGAGRLSAAAEAALGDEPHSEVRAVVGGVVQGADAQAVQVVAAGLQVLVVVCPGLLGVIGDPGGEEDGLPELFHGGAGALAGEDLLGPGCTGDGGNAPLLAIFQLILIGFDDGVAHAAGLGDLLHIDALQAVGVFGHQMDAAGHHIHLVLILGLLPLLHGAHGGDGAIAGMDLGQGLIAPLHGNLFGLGLIGLLHHHLDKLRLVQVRIDDDLLALLNIDAASDDQAGIFPQYGFFHDKSFLSEKIIPIIAGFMKKVNGIAILTHFLYNKPIF